MGKALAVLRKKSWGVFCHFCHWSKAGPALEVADEMSLFGVEMSLPKPELSLRMSLAGVELSLSLLSCFRKYASFEWETLTGLGRAVGSVEKVMVDE